MTGCGASSEQVLKKPNEMAEKSASSSAKSQASEVGDSSAATSKMGTALYQNLLAQFHLADVYQDGLWIDFGTPARLKYTNGNWNSGWQHDGVESGATVTVFRRRARIFLPVGSEGASVIQLRAKAAKPTALVLYINGKPMPDVRIGHSFSVATLSVPASVWKNGDNEISMRSASSVSVDWMHVGNVAEASQHGRILFPEVRSSDGKYGMKLASKANVDWFVHVPTEASLVIGATGEGKVSVSIDADGKDASERVDIKLSNKEKDRYVDLSAFANKHVRLRVASRSSEIVIRRLQVVRESASATKANPIAKNVVVVLIDTLRASKLKMYYDKSRVRTPAMDEFAADAIVFEHAQAPENWTKPSVASVLTSLTPMTHRTKGTSSKLPRSALTLGEVYQGAGFKTASFIANGYVSNAFGFDQGWDYYTNYIRERRNTNASNVFGEAKKWIKKNKDKRFFAYVHTIDPHVPYDPPDAFLKMYDAKPYAGQVKNRRTHLMMDDAKKNPKKYNFTRRDKQRIEALHDGEISYHDAEFGKFMQSLAAMELSEDTIVVVTSDHGEEFQEHGSWGHGHSVYQELLHVPLIVSWPKAYAARRVIEDVSTMDIAPTLLQATGVAIPEVFEGRSLIPFMKGHWTTAPHVAFSDFIDNRRVAVGGGAKLIVRGNLRHAFFDLKKDPWEKYEGKGAQTPIAMRYLRIHLGQFLGVPDRGEWVSPQIVRRGKKSATRKPRHKKENQQMTPELCRQLVALGYVTDECERLLN